MLQGSLHTVALAEVLQFLESTTKTGELKLTGTGGQGRLWFDEGYVSGFETRSSREPAEAVFELMSLVEGEFVFTSADASRPTDPAKVAKREVGPLLAEAKALCDEWSAILGVVPSLDRRVELAADTPSDTVSIARDQWAAIVAIGSGRTVSEVIALRDTSEIAGCRVIRNLVEAGLVTVCEPEVKATIVTSAFELADTGVYTNGHSTNGSSTDAPYDVEAEAAASSNGDGAAGNSSAGILGFDFGSLVAEFPVAAVTEPEADGSDYEGFSIGNLSSGSGLGGEQATPMSSLADAGSESSTESASDPGADDRYAALRAAMLELGENLSHPDPSTGDDEDGTAWGQAVDPDADSTDQPGAPFRTLLDEVSSLIGDVETSEAGSDDPMLDGDGRVDALADRGPWSERELQAIHERGMWDDADSTQPSAVADGGHRVDSTESEEDASADDELNSGSDEPADEPINRGLLLKFLSSVRN